MNISTNSTTTTIQSRNNFVSETDRRIAILEEKYRKINEQNKRKDNPEEYVYDKYKSPHSPYFRWDLTEEERTAAYNVEWSWLRFGHGDQYNVSYDAAFRGEGYVYDNEEVKSRKEFNRTQVNNQIATLLAQNEIKLPEGGKWSFTINPNTFQVKVNGTGEEELLKRLEIILNEGTNGRELFYHIIQSSSDNNSQITKEKYHKYLLVKEIQKITGYDLKELKNENGKFIIDDGINIYDLYVRGLKKQPYFREFGNDILSTYGSQLYELGKNGYNSIPDLILSINYENGSLKDIG